MKKGKKKGRKEDSSGQKKVQKLTSPKKNEEKITIRKWNKSEKKEGEKIEK